MNILTRIRFFIFFVFLAFFSYLYRAAAWVEEPVCVFPVEKIALWKLLAACHLENNDGESCHEGNNDDFDGHIENNDIDNEDHDYGDDNIDDYDDQDQDLDQDHVEIPSSLSPWEQW